MSSDIQNDDVVIKVDHVSKCFNMYEKPRHRLQQMLFGRWKTWYKEFWALKDVSFEIKRGDCVGIIGRNGAGKSTILQIITGTLQPTSGQVIIKPGIRIAALLELGSGFNPEFTGRDNVYMNASILGLTKEETDKAMPEIEKFADIGEFIDQPVKAYSSGMMVRLAFAVQVMINPDLLIVDEALAVGDAMFQQKCIQRIHKLQEEGVTILFVSHAIATIQSICNKAVYMTKGEVDSFGDVTAITERYFRLTIQDNPELEKEIIGFLSTQETDDARVIDCASPEAMKSLFRIDPNFGKYDLNRIKNPKIEFTALDIYNSEGKHIPQCHVFEWVTQVASFIAHENFPAGLLPGVSCKNDRNENIFWLTSEIEQKGLPALKKDHHYIVLFRYKNNCTFGRYFFNIQIRIAYGITGENYNFDNVSQAAMIDVIPRRESERRQYRGWTAIENPTIQLLDITETEGAKK